nr:hypothetical protein [Shewanella ferrihydritica]
PRVGDEGGLLNCLLPPNQGLTLLIVLQGNDVYVVLGYWLQTSNGGLRDTRAGPRDHFSGRRPRLLILDDVAGNPGTWRLP